jgi:diaminobutyrate-2-oxoglutarate transaminase
MPQTIGSSTDTDVFDQHESMVRSYCRWFHPVLATARGSIMRDTDGREYLDFLAGAGALNYGHNDPDLKAALLSYLDADGIAHGLDLFTDVKREFLKTFHDLVLRPRGLDHRVQFTGPTGANAVEAGLKLARKVTGRNNVIAFTDSFHGVSLGALAATANAYHRMGPEQGLHGITRMPFDGYVGAGMDTADLLERMLNDPSSGIDAPAAILLETVQGEGGLNVASPAWLRRVAALARRHGALLIVDDVQAGCGRTGAFFSFEDLGVTPDLIVLSKSLSGFGLPMAVLLVRPCWDAWSPGEHNGTFRGNGHAFVTATAALRKFWSDDALVVDVDRRAALVRSRLRAIADAVPGSRVKGRGMMQGIDLLDGPRAVDVRAECARDGLLIECAGPKDEVVKVFAPLTTEDDLLHRGLDILQDAVASVFGHHVRANSVGSVRVRAGDRR